MLESYQTNSGNRPAIVQFRAKLRRQNLLYRFGFGAIINQNPSFDDALQSRDFHFKI
jgi:hypothetical protein